MFSPYGYGPLPPSAMAEIERKTAALRGIHRMLELDKQQKVRLTTPWPPGRCGPLCSLFVCVSDCGMSNLASYFQQMEQLKSGTAAAPLSLPPPPVEPAREDTLQARRAEAIVQQQKHLTLKTAQRNVILPPLSIAIPLPTRSDKRDQPRAAESEFETEKGSEPSVGDEAGSTVEPLPKQVKFLAPDDAEMSDQSSICQSPSWEGYGRRKKEKKKEAERRKKEKEQAERDARAAKRRTATRLSKSPPPEINGRTSRAGGLTNSDRSMSDPLLISQYLLAENQSQNHPRDVERAVSADDLQRLQPQQPAMAEVISDDAHSTARFVGGVKLDREREEALQSHLANYGQIPPSLSHHLARDDGVDGQSYPRSPPSDGSAPTSHSSSQSIQARQEGRPTREMFPPSASRTPMLRQMSTTAHHRSNSLLQGASKIFRGRDGKSSGDTEVDRGRHRDGRSHQHRDQSGDRSVAEAAYEQLVNNGSLYSSSTRSSSRHTQHGRRPSFSQEAKSVALKIAGIRTTPAAKEESKRASIHTDYFNYPDHASSGPDLGASASSEAGLTSDGGRLTEERPGTSVYTPHGPGAPVFYERPATTQSSVNSSNPSIAGSVPSHQSKKTRSLRDAAKAALSISRGGPQSPTFPKTSHLAVPDATFRSRVESRLSPPSQGISTLGSDMMAPTAVSTLNAPETVPAALTQTPSLSPPKPAAVEAHAGSRVSEGSSSSSAYEDGSPLPSPVTTPDTSRPQSSKDLPFIARDIKHATDSLASQDDDVTLRQSSDGSSTSSTPRLAKSEEHENAEMTEEDRWSRTALPVDIDTDAQSFTTSFTHLDHIDNIDETLADAQKQQPYPAPASSEPSRETSRAAVFPNTPSTGETSSEGFIEPTIKIPPRSKKRDLVGGRSPTSPGQLMSPGASSPESITGQEARDKVNSQETSRELVSSPSGGRTSQSQGEQLGDAERRKHRKRHQPKESLSGDVQMPQTVTARERRGSSAATTEDMQAPLSENKSSTSSVARPAFAANGLNAYLDVAGSNPYLADFPGMTKTQYATVRGPGQARTTPSSPESPRFPRTASPSLDPVARTGLPPRMTSAPTPLLRPSSAASTRSSSTAPAASGPFNHSPASRPPPVSILKQPSRSTSDPAQPTASGANRAPVLSALPKHMQLQAGISARPPLANAGLRKDPVAKMFVECCNCKFYHDMPSKLYECMAKPDAVVEDKLLGISGAITTMVKCPWCQHNMTISCCAGYAAVVYLKEKLH